MIIRTLQKTLESQLFKGKMLIVTGPRQVGKTTLFKQIIAKYQKNTLSLNCDEPDVRALLNRPTSVAIRQLVGNAEIVLLEEAQRVADIGITLKLAFDNLPQIQFLVTGSSALELSNQINEPLTGRKFEYNLFPISTQELVLNGGLLEAKRSWQHRVIYGSYPDVINQEGNEQEVLKNLSDSYLYKDVFSFQDVRKPEVFDKLLKALALQIGSEVSYNELAQLVGADTETVQRYIDLLEKTFIVFRLPALSRNVRNELKKSRKIFFYDNGIRNAILNNFHPFELREDRGALWENFMVSERLKYIQYNRLFSNLYFWRTTQQQEIDLIEERAGMFYCYEFKSNPKARSKFPKTFTDAYPNHELAVVHPDNFTDFLT